MTASRLASDYGMLGVLLALGAYFSVMTWSEQYATGRAAADEVAADIVAEFGAGARVLIAVRDTVDDAAYAESLDTRLRALGYDVVTTLGYPHEARRAIQATVDAGARIDVIAATPETARWALFEQIHSAFPSLAHVRVVHAPKHSWPSFLQTANLLNIANQVAVIAILAIGMTLVIITGGIDLSVGSLVALSAVLATLLIREYAGAEQAGLVGMVLCSAVAIAVCALAGSAAGVLVAVFEIPAFIVTLGSMLVARGIARILTAEQSVYQVPHGFVWLGRHSDLGGVPNAVVLMLGLYGVAHVLMTRTALGRYIYAVGGNMEAARLSGVPVWGVLMFVYTACGMFAGLGGIVLASQLKSGSPTYGLMYELSTIAAVVVGGTSLSGGRGRVFGTLIGVFIIAVIQNGMNMTGVRSDMQMVVLGLVIVGAALVDALRKRYSRTSAR